MNIVNRTAILMTVASIAAVLGLTLMMLGSPTHASAQGEPTPRAYITVVIADGDDTVSWSDPDSCTSDYNTYLAVTSPFNDAETSRTHIGSAVSGSTEKTQTISYSGAGNVFTPPSVAVELYCGTYDASSSQNVLIALTDLSVVGFSLRRGTYSSAPLTALAISSGTLSSASDRGINMYTAEVPSDVRQITLDPTVVTGYQTDFVRNPGWGVIMACSSGDDCTYSYGGGTTIVLSDADLTTDGFQIDLARGENRLGIGVNKGSVGAGPGRLYYLTVTVENSPATGLPAITGIAQVGQTLTTVTSGISDVDGLTNVSYSYQWLAHDTEIDGATSSTYTLQPTDADRVIKVRLSFVDDVGYEESLTSEATGAVKPNVPATGAPTITGTAEVAETLTADTSGIVDSDGLDNVSFSYQWIRSDGTDDLDIDGATGDTYVVTAADVDKAIKLRVNFTDDKGSVESLTSSATAVVPIEAAFTFSIDGTVVTCDYWNEHITNRPRKECDNPSSIDQGASNAIEIETEIARSVNSQLYKFRFHIYQMEDSIGHYGSREANDLCLGPGMVDSVSIEVTPENGTGNFTYTGEGTIFELCPAGTYQLYVPWYRYNSDDEDYEYAGTFRRYFFINGNGEEDSSIEQVKWIRAVYPDTPVSHGDVQIVGTKQSTRLNRTLTTFSLSIDGLVPDSDTETTDYVVRVRVIGDGGPGKGKTVPWCHVGNVGYSYLLKTVPEDGRWEMDAHVKGSCLDHQWPDTLQVELFNGSYEFIAGEDIALGAPHNTPATGAPTISGTVQVGQTLTASTSGVVDDDGLSNASYAYQWIANDETSDSDIQDATSRTYTLVSDDVSKTIKVKVTFTDDADNEESLTSAPTAAIAATVPGTPSSLKVQPAGTGEFDVSWDAPDSNGGAEITEYTVQWKETADNWDTDSDVSSATTSETSYTITGLSLETEYSVRVIATNSVGDSPASAEESATAAAQTSQQRGSTQNTPATGAPTITGTAQVSETLTADTASIADEDGLDNVSFSYQWVVNDGTSDADIENASGTAYTLTSEDEGKTIKVRVTFTDDADNEEALTSAATAAVAAAPTTLTASIHDEPESHDGQNAFTFELRFSEELDPDFSYKTLRDHAFTVTGGTVTKARRLDPPGNVRWEITVEPSSDADVSIVLPKTTDCADQGAICTEDSRMLSAEVSLTVTGSVEEEEQSAPENNPATGGPTISGTAQVGETLTADTSGITDEDGLTDATFSYQWVSNDGTTDSDISGATNSTYTLVAAEEGKTIKVRVSFADDGGNDETLTSAATAAVAAAPTPLTASIHDTPQNHDGQSSFTFELRLSEEFDLSYVTLRDHAFTVTGGTVTKSRRLDRSSNIRWEITVVPNSNANVIVVLPVTTNCDDEGAICTDDGRMLSNRNELTVAGPSG